ncbi:tRNA-intron endonuclease catalytic domain-like protein [Schizophyllum commune H4-8]|uniref:tRNA-splicing endonuclease subunit Sen34 n=1 Tax=Schizophyllum commune (strain H4-8 / FGSC 9210) TaxID=578458 RepID=D8PWP2_SCHCM|nr:tRNA-intron endonuclease catalytic domain-like protein [Schizophyllum commune H4-8]KAI5899871.1 tRNA-intron endonuclease catalytic domain-like protein [Schizophyllum commune H4-8]
MAPVRISISNRRAFIWDVDDIATVRSRHRICGLLTGTLPRLAQQNAFLGVPLVLMSQEVTLLVEKGFAVLVDDALAHRSPSPEEAARWADAQTADIESQLAAAEELSRNRQTNVADKSMSEEAIRKRKEREAKRAAKAQQSEDAAVFVPPPEEAPAPSAQPSQASIFTISLPASSSGLLWYEPENKTYTTLEAAREADLWTYPETLQDRAQYGVFRDLWEQSYFMGIGIRFGADYLVYPGDPLRYHSHFAATVIESPDAPMRPMEIVAHGRLGTATKKAHLLCSWDDDKRTVSYLSIEWAGFG